MKSAKTHVIASAALSALTFVVLLAARGSLPDQVPMQWGLTGEASSFWPRDAVVFGVPVACVVISLLVGLQLAGRGEERASRYYVAPALELVATAIIVFLGTR